jgi:alpha-mannosidase
MHESRAFSTPLATWAGSGHPGSLADGYPLLRFEGEGIDVTAVKRAESRDSVVVRLVNLSSAAQAVMLGLGVPLREAHRLNLAEERHSTLKPDDGDMVQVQAAPREIVTVELVPAR